MSATHAAAEGLSFDPAGAGALAAGTCRTGPTGGSAAWATPGVAGLELRLGFGPTGVAPVGSPGDTAGGSPAGAEGFAAGWKSAGCASAHGLQRPHVASQVPGAMNGCEQTSGWKASCAEFSVQ